MGLAISVGAISADAALVVMMGRTVCMHVRHARMFRRCAHFANLGKAMKRFGAIGKCDRDRGRHNANRVRQGDKESCSSPEVFRQITHRGLVHRLSAATYTRFNPTSSSSKGGVAGATPKRDLSVKGTQCASLQSLSVRKCQYAERFQKQSKRFRFWHTAGIGEQSNVRSGVVARRMDLFVAIGLVFYASGSKQTFIGLQTTCSGASLQAPASANSICNVGCAILNLSCSC